MESIGLILLVSFFVLANAGNSHVLGAEPESRPTTDKPLDYAIVVTGGELLEGAYPDAHTHFITRTLRQLGCHCVSSVTVDDQHEAIHQALRFVTNQVPLIILTGGLGPTPNDITRQTLSDFTGIPLREHPDVLAEMERRFRQPRDQIRPTLRQQCLVPSRGSYLKNANGTAVGLIFDFAPSTIVALPGPPRELQPMVRGELVPYLQQRFGVRAFGSSLTLRFVGAGQSLITQTIRDHVAVAPDVTMTSLFEDGRVDFTFSLPGHTAADEARLKQLAGSVREHLNEYIYAEDGSSLEEVVGAKILARGGSLVLVELGSGGHLAAVFNGTKSAARLLAGAYAAPAEETMARLLKIPPDERGKTGDELLTVLGNAAASQTQSTWVIAVGRVETEAGGSKTIRIGFKTPGQEWEVRRLSIRDTDVSSIAQLTTQILDLLRKRLK